MDDYGLPQQENYRYRPPKWEVWYAWHPIRIGELQINEQQVWHAHGWKWLTVVARRRFFPPVSPDASPTWEYAPAHRALTQ